MTNKTSSDSEVPVPVQPIFILMRHASRDFTEDGLSLQGHQQAAKLADAFRQLKISMPTRIECSPKNRTRQTLRFLENECGLSARIEPRLDERHSFETMPSFETRVKNYCDDVHAWAEKSDQDLSNKNETVDASNSAGLIWLACSHLDWLENAALFLPSDENDFERAEPWHPMAVRAYTYADGIWKRIKRGAT